MEAIGHIASSEYQKASWFGAGELVSSPIEAYCELFDDQLFEDFLESAGSGLSEHQRRAGRRLVDELERFADSVGERGLRDAHAVYLHPDWEDVRRAASECLQAFSY